jgi:hypothetical protein
MTAPLCVFATVMCDGDTTQVVCVNCGRPVTLPTSHANKIIASCRGDAETRWRRDGSARVCHVGSELKAMLAAVGIRPTSDCPCETRASELDARGCDWCESNIDTIVGWLREEAEKRGLPFLDVAGRLLVRRAIRNARRAAAN